MSRALHHRDVCERVDHDLQTELDTHLDGEVLVVAPEDDRLTSLVPIHGQATLFGTQLNLGDATFYSAPLPTAQQSSADDTPAAGQTQLPTGDPTPAGGADQPPTDDDAAEAGSDHFPRNNEQRFHFATNAFDTVVSLFSICGYFQRGPPFLDLTRITREGGTLLSITGLQPDAPPDHDAKWWVPNSDDAALERLRILRHDQFKTPIVVAVFTATSSTAQHPDADIVTSPRRPP